MQIRIANRQDEKKIVAFVEAIFEEHGMKLDLVKGDADLKNVEANYFGRDGFFLVAEEEQKLVGIACANMIDLDTCALRRICVAAGFRRKGIGRKMLSIVTALANRLDYKKLVATDSAASHEVKAFLDHCGFKPACDGDYEGQVELSLSQQGTVAL